MFSDKTLLHLSQISHAHHSTKLPTSGGLAVRLQSGIFMQKLTLKKAMQYYNVCFLCNTVRK